MPDHPRLEDLRRRVHMEPASIAFAQLAEECRRAGEHQEAVDVCTAGLAIHPDYASARVTLGRALLQLNRLDDAQFEFQRVLTTAPDNLAAIRGLAQVHERHGLTGDALTQYRAALGLAPNDPELEQTVARLSREVESGAAIDRSATGGDDERAKAAQDVAALEQWLHAIHAARADRRA